MAGDSASREASVTVAQLQRTRTAYKGQLTRLEAHISDHETGAVLLDEHHCAQLTARVQDFTTKISEVNARIFQQTPEEDLNSAVDDAHEIELRIWNILSRLQAIQVNCSAATPPISQSASSHTFPSVSHVKLPSFDLPKFSGAFEEWLNFQDIFKATIDGHTALTDAQKLQYLKSCVQGEASSLISSYPLTSGHYAQAWNKLVSHYDNKRRIALAIYKKFSSIQPLKTESAAGLRKLLMVIDECMDKWNVMGFPVDQWDFLLMCHVMDRLDPVTKRSWATSLHENEVPTYKETCKFLNTYISGLETNRDPKPVPQRERKFTVSHHTASSEICPVCKNGSHLIFRCPRFKGYTPEERISKVKSLGNCTICLQSHPTKDCVRDWRCRKCGKTHNSLLHIERKSHDIPSTSGNSNTNTNSNSNANTQVVLHNTQCDGQSNNANHVLFMTAKVQLVNPISSSIIPGRVFLDSGSEISIVDEESVRLLGLKKHKTDVQISGLAMANVSRAKFKVYFMVKSLVNDSSFQVEAVVLPRVTMSLPRFNFETASWPHLDGLTLADPQFNISSKINVLLGVDICYSIMRAGIRQGPRFTPTAQNSILGWLLAGKMKDSSSSSHVTVNHFLGQEVDAILEKFWRLESVPTKQHFSKEEQACELYFQKTIARLDNGRFQVRLPFRDNKEQLGESRTMAVKRLLSLEKRFGKFPKQKIQYIDFMNEYMTMGHMTEVVPNNETKGYYLPHHFVLKDNSTTTKLRVVFDGSAKTSSGLSLNNCLMVGPTVQPDLFSLLLKFRYRRVAIKADIAKMYRQFAVHPDDAKYQLIVWRESPTLPIKSFQLNTVTYGTSAAPFLATRCLNQLAIDNREKFPVGARAAEESFYVDDLIDSVDTEEQAICIFTELSSMLSTAQLDIRKWASNSSKFLNVIPKELHEKEISFNIADNTIYALGIQWNSVTDCFYYSFDKCLCARNMTKRQLLSQLASVFDPIGFLAPLTIRAKLIFQSLWKTKIDWDDEIPASLQIDWSSYTDDLQKLNSLAIPRWVKSTGSSNYSICGFSDASEKAYGACVYVVATNEGRMTSHLLVSKTKVAPIKFVSIPRLELCGALLLAELVDSCVCALKLSCEIRLFTDSTITLSWIQGCPSRWKTFVANRVAKIQELVPLESWHHVSGPDNPADLASRGIQAAELLASSLWWHGPEWLVTNDIPTVTSEQNPAEVEKEAKSEQKLVSHTLRDVSLLKKFSRLIKLLRVVAYIIRFKANCAKKDPRLSGELTPLELNNALLCVCKLSQVSQFPEEVTSLREQKPVSRGSKLLSLDPFLDEHGVLRVGGRLQHSTLDETTKHPIILSHKCVLVQLLINKIHLDTLHGSFQTVYSQLRQKFWVTRARDVTRHIVRRCVPCRKIQAKRMTQLMGSLPAPRVNVDYPFNSVGIDFAGPYTLLHRKGRGGKVFKGYFCIFVCLITRCIHLEAVTDMTAEGFLACFKRFTGRRGKPSKVYSDCGTNFVGANKDIQAVLGSTEFNQSVCHSLTDLGITWHFNPPAAPHQGGLWEAGVKSVKYHLKRIIGSTHLTLEEFQTLLCSVESVLNSRPLCPMSVDPLDFDFLTPGHFLIGRNLLSLPENNVSVENTHRLSRFQVVSKFSQLLWKRWSHEYLISLQQRSKWRRREKNIQVDDLVVIHDENLAATHWRMGRVTQVHPGSDGLVRVVTLRTATGSIKRPITKVSPLLSSEEMAHEYTPPRVNDDAELNLQTVRV